MPYVYEEGVVPVPAKRCTRCGGPLQEGPGGEAAGWFEPSTLDAGTWVFVSGREVPTAGPALPYRCTACGLAFTLHPGSSTLEHPQPEAS